MRRSSPTSQSQLIPSRAGRIDGERTPHHPTGGQRRTQTSAFKFARRHRRLRHPGANNSWTLAQAAEPARTKDEEAITPDEKQASAAKPLGKNSFRLQTSTRASIDFSFDPFKGQKVLAKGVLIREPNNDRIRVTSVERLGAACAP